MSIIAVILASSLAVLSYKIEKRLYNPVTLFCGIWALVILFAALHLYGMKEASDYAYSIMTLGIVCFSFGSYIALSIRKRFRISLIRKKQSSNASGNYNINYPVVYVVGTIVLVYLVVESIVAFFAYRSGIQMNELRSSMMGYSTTNGFASARSACVDLFICIFAGLLFASSSNKCGCHHRAKKQVPYCNEYSCCCTEKLRRRIKNVFDASCTVFYPSSVDL